MAERASMHVFNYLDGVRNGTTSIIHIVQRQFAAMHNIFKKIMLKYTQYEVLHLHAAYLSDIISTE